MAKEAEFDQDVFDSMLHGSFEPEEVEVETEVEEEEDNSEHSPEDSEDQEDTDQEDESEEEEELDEDGDGDLDEDLEDEDEDEEEDSLVDGDSLDEEEGDTEDEDLEADEAEELEDEDTDDKSEDDTDTEDPSDGEDSDTEEIDYKAFYEAVVNTEFTVNGHKTKGFSDPKKIIQSQQMAGGFSEKMAGFKQYRPYMAPLKERGMLDDPAKFDLAMNLIDGDKEAIKKHLASLEIDPIELDMDKIEYSRKPTTASEETLILEDVLDRAKTAGVDDRVKQVIGKEWDDASYQEFIDNPAVRNDLLTHIESGVYDTVQAKISELSRSDFSGTYSQLSSINKYKAAVIELQKETAATTHQAPKKPKVDKTAATKAKIKAEKAKIAQAREDEVYKAKATKREADIKRRRAKAASMSKPKAKAKPKAKFDPLKVEGTELDNLMDFLKSGGR